MLRNPINAQQENDSENAEKFRSVRTLIVMLNHRFACTLCVQTTKKCSLERRFHLFFYHFLLCYGESGKFYLNLLLLESKQDAPQCENKYEEKINGKLVQSGNVNFSSIIRITCFKHFNNKTA